MAESEFGDIPFRIRIAAAGSRSPELGELLRASVSRVLGKQPRESRILELFGPNHAEFLDSLTHTKIAFTFVTSFYEGANQLLAEEIMKLEGSRVQLILPYEESEYEKKFSTDKTRAAFQSLLKNESVIRFPIRLQRESTDQNQAIRRAHRYIVDHCDAVIVIGDPNTDELDLIDYAILKKRPIIRIQANSDIAFEIGYGLNSNPLRRLEQFNKKRIPQKEIELYSNNVFKDIFEKEGVAGDRIPVQSKATIRKLLIPNYARASIIAKRYQRDYKLAGNLVYIFSVFAAVSVALAVKWEKQATALYAIELILLGSILGAVIFLIRKDSHKRWIETRFLAERIRAATYLAAAGVEVSPIYLPPYMGAAHRQDDWMVMAFHEIWERMPLMKGCEGEECGLISTFIDKAWIEDQMKYHEAKAKRFHK